jgi:hypothetical protein
MFNNIEIILTNTSFIAIIGIIKLISPLVIVLIPEKDGKNEANNRSNES